MALVIAAPDMLAALNTLANLCGDLEIFYDGAYPEHCAALKAAEAALAKAEGGPQ